jgi:ELWxxDGT repeat protein
MKILKPLTALSIGALLATCMVSPAQAETFGPTPYRIADIEPGAGAVVGSKVVFSARPPGGDSELWVTNGAPGGTKLLKDIYPGSTSSGPSNFVAFKGKVFFVALDPIGGNEIWSTDGTSTGTRRVSDINPSSFLGAINQLTVSGDRLYFAAKTLSSGLELWSTDGTSANTRMIRDIQTGPGDSLPAALTPFSGGLAFSAVDANNARRPWATDGTAANTRLLDGGSGGIATEVTEMASLGSTVVFRASNGAGRELWRSSGEPLSATLLKDIAPGATDSNPAGFVTLGDTTFFRASTPLDGYELWSTDGSRGGTQQVRDIFEGSGSSQPEDLIATGDSVYFNADDGVHGKELWGTRGSASSTRLVKDIHSGTDPSIPSDKRFVGERLIFTAGDPTHGRELWSTDGTADHTQLTGDIAPGTVSAFPEDITNLRATQLFDAQVDGRHQLWAYTTRASSTQAYPKSSYSRSDGSNKRIRIKVAVRATGITPTGTVVLRKGSKTIGTARLSSGVALVRITIKLGKGRHTVKAFYLGSTGAQVSTSSSFIVKVR